MQTIVFHCIHLRILWKTIRYNGYETFYNTVIIYGISGCVDSLYKNPFKNIFHMTWHSFLLPICKCTCQYFVFWLYVAMEELLSFRVYLYHVWGMSTPVDRCVTRINHPSLLMTICIFNFLNIIFFQCVSMSSVGIMQKYLKSFQPLIYQELDVWISHDAFGRGRYNASFCKINSYGIFNLH